MGKPTSIRKGAGQAGNGGPSGFAAFFYNLLMLRIEPELTTFAIACHDDWYAKETAEEMKRRLERYARAFATLEERFKGIARTWREQIAAFRRNALAGVATRDAEKDARELTDIEQSISGTAA